MFMPTPSPLDRREAGALVDRIGVDRDSPDAVENQLVEAVRLVASREPERVGNECLAVLIIPGCNPRIRFHAVREHSTVVEREDRSTVRVPIGYTPWLIAPRIATAPQRVAGPAAVGMGLVRIGRMADEYAELQADVDAPRPPETSRIVFSARTQPRKPPPGGRRVRR